MSITILRANALALPLADSSVDLVVTSPPYFGLRSYQDGGEHYEGQIGSEATPHEFVDALIAATREMVRVLKPSGSIFVNLGDKYVADNRGSGGDAKRGAAKWAPAGPAGYPGEGVWQRKSLMLLPERYRIRAVDELGLIARAVVIWSKPNGLPESVTDRVRRSHEDWVHLTKQPRYYSAVDEIREAHVDTVFRGTARLKSDSAKAATGDIQRGLSPENSFNPLGKLPSSVWEINEEESLVRCVLSAIHAGSLTIDEGERLLKGQAWTGAHDSGVRSTSPVTAGSGRQDARPRDTASSGSTAGRSSRTESPLSSATDPSPMDSSSTTSAASGIASGTLSPSLSATTSCAGQAPSPPSTQPRPTAATGTSSRTPTPTDPQTEAACAESACEQRTDAPTGEGSAPQPDAPGSVWVIPTEPLRVPDHLGIDHFAAFPMEWPRRIITGWSPREVCTACGEGRRPVTVGERTDGKAGPITGAAFGAGRFDTATGKRHEFATVRTLTGYACACPDTSAPATPGVVLDPFGGTGTTALVADVLGRDAITVDLSADYCRLAQWRTTDPGQRAKAARVEAVDPVSPDQPDLFGDPA